MADSPVPHSPLPTCRKLAPLRNKDAVDRVVADLRLIPTLLLPSPPFTAGGWLPCVTRTQWTKWWLT